MPVLDRTRDANIRELAQEKLFALQNPMKLDGRVSSYPASARGYSVTNCYVLDVFAPARDDYK